MSAHRRRPRLLLSLLAVAFAGCGGDPESGVDRADVARPGAPDSAVLDEPVTVVDAEGRTVSLSTRPARIVSLVPAATQVLLEVGAGHRMVGRTENDTALALAGLPSVGGGLHPSLEVLVALEPDLVIRFAGATDRETPARLDRAGVAHLAVAPESVADIRAMIRDLGRVVGRTGTADSLVTSIDGALAEVRALVADRAPVRVAWVMAGRPPWVAGPGTFIDELITLAGGENVFHDLERRWAAVSPESLVAREPDLFLTPDGERLDPRITRDVPVRTLSPVVQLPGPHLPEAAREIARALHSVTFR